MAEQGSRTQEILDEMEADIPVIRDFQPLASGIEDTLSRRFPNDPSWRVIAALRRHIQRPAYLRTILSHQERLDLDGKPVARISEAERLHAKEQLAAQGEGIPAEGEDALGQITEGFRLLLCKQIHHRFGSEVARKSRPYLDGLHNETPLEKAGTALLDCSTAQEWLDFLENRLP
jgi:hypothetical protein